MRQTCHRLAALLIAVTGLTGVGCSESSPSVLDATSRAAVVSDVEAFFVRYRQAFNAAETDAILDLYVSDDRFALYEDGVLRYPSPQAIVDGLASLPPGMSMSTTGDVTNITPLTNDLATASTTYQTKVSMPDGNTFDFGGVMTALLERTNGGWKIVTAHTSSLRERRGS